MAAAWISAGEMAAMAVVVSFMMGTLCGRNDAKMIKLLQMQPPNRRVNHLYLYPSIESTVVQPSP
jgi:hypothetical protein